MKLKSKAAIAFFSVLACTSAFATSESSKTIQQVGVQSNGPGYVIFNEPLTVGCSYTLVYLPDLSTSSGKAMLAALLSAQASGKGVSRIDYTQAADSTCTATIVSVGP